MSTEKRLVDTECRIHGILAQLTKMDQDTVTDNQFLVQRLAQMEQAFDNHLAKEINNLADHTANAWVSFDKQESENMARLTSSMDDAEEDVRTLSSKLDALTSYIKGMEANLEIKSEQLKEEAITRGGETTTLKSKLEIARQSQEDNRARIQALENATPKPKEDLINSILIRLTRLEDNQSELIRGFNPPAYPPRIYDKVTR